MKKKPSLVDGDRSKANSASDMHSLHQAILCPYQEQQPPLKFIFTNLAGVIVFIFMLIST